MAVVITQVSRDAECSIGLHGIPLERICTKETTEKSSQGTDRYISREEPRSNNRTSFWGRIGSWFKQAARKVIHRHKVAFHAFRKINPFSIALDYIEERRCSGALEQARNRNGARTHEELRRYHESLRFNESNPDPRRLFTFHPSNKPGPRPLVILFLGNKQDHTCPSCCAGILELRDRLVREGNVHVAVFRTGDAVEQLRFRYGLTSDTTLHPWVVQQHTRNIIEDIVQGRGLFRGHKVSNVGFVGYSWGGGAADLIINNWNGPQISFSAYVDAIQLGTENVGLPVAARPNHSGIHCNFYQNNTIYLNGTNHSDCECSELISSVEGHNQIDDNERVIRSILALIRRTS